MRHAFLGTHSAVFRLLTAVVGLLATMWALPAHAEDACGWVPTFGEAVAGVNYSAKAFLQFGGSTYIVGNFTHVGGGAAGGIARWDGHAWVAVPNSPFIRCWDGVVFDDGSGPALYCAGDVPHQGAPMTAVMRWDGATWTGMGALLSYRIYTMEAIDLGTGPKLYIGGPSVSTLDGTHLGHVSSWNGTQWQPVGDGFQAGSIAPATAVYALAAFDDGEGVRLYAGGVFAKNASNVTLNNIARLENGHWQPVGSGVTVEAPGEIPWVHSLLSVPDDVSGQPSLYAGGTFTKAGGQPAPGLARWASGRWNPVAVPGAAGGWDVVCLARLALEPGAPERLCAAGRLNSSTGVFLAYQDGSQWHAFPGALSSDTDAVNDVGWVQAPGGSAQLACCGQFCCIDGLAMGGLSYWNGAQWGSNGRGLNGPIHASIIFDDGQGDGPALFVGGEATAALGETFGYIAKWTGTTWRQVGAGLNGAVYALTVFDDGTGPRLVAGGAFTKSGATDVVNVARWNGTEWSAMGSGIPSTPGFVGIVQGLASFHDGLNAPNATLYAMSKNTSLPGLARFDGAEWRPVGTIAGISLRCGLVWNDGSGEALWVGGASIKNGSEDLGPLARFDGKTWSAPREHPSSEVYAMTVLREPGDARGKLVVAGGPMSMRTWNHVAAWDGVAWSDFHDSFNGLCYALTTVYDPTVGRDVLVVGGSFTSNGSTSMNGVAAWNGHAWWALGAGTWGSYPKPDNPPIDSRGVRTLLNAPTDAIVPGESGHTLVVGGAFFWSGGGDGGLARWNMCSISADLNGDGTVNGVDLGLLLGSWGPCDGCAADLNQDGLVNGSDLGLLLGVWTG